MFSSCPVIFTLNDKIIGDAMNFTARIWIPFPRFRMGPAFAQWRKVLDRSRHHSAKQANLDLAQLLAVDGNVKGGDLGDALWIAARVLVSIVIGVDST